MSSIPVDSKTQTSERSPDIDAELADQHGLEKSEEQEHERVNAGAVLRKLDLRILPLITAFYVFAFLDRTNIGNAKVAGIVTDLHLTGLQYNLCSAIFFITYCFFEIPANITMKLWRPSRWLPLIMFCWGSVMVSMAFVKSFGGLLTARVVLGMTESGMFPGITSYLCSWYPRASQAQRISIFSSSSSMAGAFGGILAYGIERMNGIGGLAGWSWIFLLEGLVTVVLATMGFVCMYDHPENAPFLTSLERAWLVAKIKSDTAGLSKQFKWKFLWQALRDPHAYLFVGIFLFNIIPAYTFALFLPTIINGLGFSAANAQLLSVPPNAASFVFTILFGVLSDKYCMRGPFVLAGSTLALVGYVILFATSSPNVGYAAVVIGGCGLNPTVPLMLAWAGGNMGGDVKRAVVLAMVIGFGNLGGVAASFIYRPQDSPRYHPGHATNIACLCVAIVLSTCAMFEFARQNRTKVAKCERHGITEDNESDFMDIGDASPLFRCDSRPPSG